MDEYEQNKEVLRSTVDKFPTSRALHLPDEFRLTAGFHQTNNVRGPNFTSVNFVFQYSTKTETLKLKPGNGQVPDSVQLCAQTKPIMPVRLSNDIESFLS